MYMYFLCLIMVTANYAMGHIVYFCLMPNTHFLLQISRCDTCQRVNKKMASTTPELHPVPVKSPWYHLGVDFVGPITPTSHNGNRYILTVNDHFTKWGEAVALPSKCAQGTAEALFKVCQAYICYWHVRNNSTCSCIKFLICAPFLQIFMRMGLPHVLTTDQGREFNNQLNKELMKRLGVKHRLTTAYHPQVAYTLYAYQ